jgi:hypothetical protein
VPVIGLYRDCCALPLQFLSGIASFVGVLENAPIFKLLIIAVHNCLPRSTVASEIRFKCMTK